MHDVVTCLLDHSSSQTMHIHLPDHASHNCCETNATQTVKATCPTQKKGTWVSRTVNRFRWTVRMTEISCQEGVYLRMRAAPLGVALREASAAASSPAITSLSFTPCSANLTGSLLATLTLQRLSIAGTSHAVTGGTLDAVPCFARDAVLQCLATCRALATSSSTMMQLDWLVSSCSWHQHVSAPTCKAR